MGSRNQTTNTIYPTVVTVRQAVRKRWSSKKIIQLVNSGVPTETLSDALVAAATYDRKDIMSLLLDRGANINAVGGDYGTALASAAYRGYQEAVSLLLDRGANINLVDGEYGAALTMAAYYGQGQVVSLLLDRGANINLVGGKYGTALATAACRGYKKVVSLLLDRGANINLVGSEYGTALAVAVYLGENEAVSLLLDRGANINVVGGKYGTALATAVYLYRRIEVVSLLLDRGADTNLVGGEYGTALVTAASKGQTHTLSLLLDRGADINLVVDGKYGTALAAGTSSASKDTVSLLLDRGADINHVASESGTVLGQAIYEGSTQIALFLLERGADVMRVGGCYSTLGMYPNALDVAHSKGNRVNPSLLLRLQTAIRERSGPLVDDLISRSPFPIPSTQPRCSLCTNRPQRALPPSLIDSFDILSTQVYAGGIITPKQANVSCKELGEEVLRRALVALVNLNKDTARAKYQWIENDVRYFVACNLDFGLAYAAARVAWEHFGEHSSRIISINRGRWHKHAQELDKARAKAIEIDSIQQELILSPYSIMPRRIWDLKSNRVVDFRMLHAAQSTIDTRPTFWAVTHSWASHMSPVWTSINQYQWPVPLPKDISLEHVRSELLTLGAEYVWIDVLCLRQQSEVDSLEQLRQKEWKLDVPTIGNIYRAAAHIVRYFNGLGVHFSNKDWDGPRHWLQRAWTLQEIAAESTTINGGIPRDQGKVFLDSEGEVSGKIIKLRGALRPVIQLAAQVDSQHGCDLYELAREMSRRKSTKDVDKLAGLFYLLRTTKLPCYDEKKTSEDIWTQCFHLLPAGRKAEFLLNFPYRGSEEQWFPTWAQVLDWPVRDPEYDHIRPQISLASIKTTSGEVPLFIGNVWTIPDAIFTDGHNAGQYEVKIRNLVFGFYLPYLLQEPLDIQDSVFTLAIADLGHAYNWVLCKPMDRGQRVGTAAVGPGVAEFKVLKKVGVIRTDSSCDLLVGKLLQKVDCLFV